MRPVLASLLSLCLVASLAHPSLAALAPPASTGSESSQDAGCGRVAVRVPDLDAPRFKTGGEDSLWAGARRRLGPWGVAISGRRVVVEVERAGATSCGEARRLVDYASSHVGEAWNADSGGGGVLGQPSGWGCRFYGVRTDPSQQLGKHVWDDAEPDVLCTERSPDPSSVSVFVVRPTAEQLDPRHGGLRGLLGTIGGGVTAGARGTGHLFKGMGEQSLDMLKGLWVRSESELARLLRDVES